MPLPTQTEPEVKTRPAAPGYLDAHATPETFGAGVGQAVQGVAAQVSAIYAKERNDAATFAAADAELRYGETQDQTLIDYAEQLKRAQAESPEDFQAHVVALHDKASAKIEEAKTKFAPKDPLAQKQYVLRTRLQQQAAVRKLTLAMNERVLDWRVSRGEAQRDSALRAASNVTGNPEEDAQNILIQSTRLTDWQKSMELKGATQDEINLKTREALSKMAANALAAYGTNYEGALKLLGTKLPGSDVQIGYAAGKTSLLDGAETAKFLKSIKEDKDTKAGVALGAQWAYVDHVTDPDAAAAAYIAKGGDPAEAAKAVAQFTALRSAQHTRTQIQEGETYKAAYNLVTAKYGGDIEAALRADDQQFARSWKALGPLQVNLRAALARDDKLDPAAYTPLMEVINYSSTPGALAKKYPTAEAFQAAFQGRTKHLWPQALAMYTRDVQRDTSQDVHYQIFKSEYDLRARNVTKFTRNADLRRNFWENADAEQQAVHAWITASAEQAWADHAQARKGTPAKVSDATWYRETLNEITREAERLKNSGAFRKGSVPEMSPAEYEAAPPGALYRVPGKAGVLRKPGALARPSPGPVTAPDFDLDTPEGTAAFNEWLKTPEGQASVNAPAE